MILIIGSGVAGLSCALAVSRAGGEATLVTPGRLASGIGERGIGAAPGDDPLAAALAGGSTALAQGGIAAAIAPGDTPEAHLADTIAAGAGLVDAEAAGVLVREGARAVRELLAAGLPVDRDESGDPRFGLEAAHSAHRIVHAGGDRTGAVLHAFLVERLLAEVAAGRISLVEDRAAVSLLREDGIVRGAVLRDAAGGLEAMRADAVVLATGGYAGLYPRSTNPVSSRGEGIV
ncbi:MAG: FAD-dependent oxidoreductase, partial [Leucobacter sp.]